jgi:hypothetical protein
MPQRGRHGVELADVGLQDARLAPGPSAVPRFPADDPGTGEVLEKTIREIFKVEPGLVAKLKEVLR